VWTAGKLKAKHEVFTGYQEIVMTGADQINNIFTHMQAGCPDGNINSQRSCSLLQKMHLILSGKHCLLMAVVVLELPFLNFG
jgi:hypothetical protein